MLCIRQALALRAIRMQGGGDMSDVVHPTSSSDHTTHGPMLEPAGAALRSGAAGGAALDAGAAGPAGAAMTAGAAGPPMTAGAPAAGTLAPEVTVRDQAHLPHPSDPEFDEVGEVVLTDLVAALIEGLGEDVSREGLIKTPHRVERSLRFLTSGYNVSVDDVINGALFTAEGSEMVVVKGIEFYSLCEHHMLPFFGTAHVAYIPGDTILGLSKFARVVDVFARRMQLQERMTTQIADALEQALKPQGVAVVTEASHLCMMMRGVEKQGSSTRTSAMRGVFQTSARTRQEFLEAIR
jgi:GTP cyclohydrolase IA